jgi:hypothetical protein
MQFIVPVAALSDPATISGSVESECHPRYERNRYANVASHITLSGTRMLRA